MDVFRAGNYTYSNSFDKIQKIMEFHVSLCSTCRFTEILNSGNY